MPLISPDFGAIRRVRVNAGWYNSLRKNEPASEKSSDPQKRARPGARESCDRKNSQTMFAQLLMLIVPLVVPALMPGRVQHGPANAHGHVQGQRQEAGNQQR